MPYEPPKPPEETGADGVGQYGAGTPDNKHQTPHFNKWPFGPHTVDEYVTDYSGDGFTTVSPEAGGAKDVRMFPFKLERASSRKVDDEGNATGDYVNTLRCYYGEFRYCITVIETEPEPQIATDGAGGSTGGDVYGVLNQHELPGISTIIPTQFTTEPRVADNAGQADNEVTVKKYCEFQESEDEAGNSTSIFGTVVLKFKLDPVEFEVTDCSVELMQGDPENISNTPVHTLKQATLTGADEAAFDGGDGEAVGYSGDPATGWAALKRVPNDDEGTYYVVIGRSIDLEERAVDDDGEEIFPPEYPNEGKKPIVQQTYENIYYSTTILKGSFQRRTSPPPPTTTPGSSSSPEFFEAPFLEPEGNRIPSFDVAGPSENLFVGE